MIVKPIKTRIFKEGEDVTIFIKKQIKKIPEKSVLVVTSKIVALAERRTAEISDEKSKERLIKKESNIAIKTKYAWLTIKDGMFMASAGIDESNGNGKLILLPKDSFKSAKMIREKLKKIYKIKNLGVLITDSRTLPLRAGVIGLSLGYAGFKGIRDYRKNKDIFGRKFHFSRTNVADGLASAAVLEMGEGNEKLPLALITNSRIEFTDKTIRKNEIKISLKADMYAPFFKRLK